MHKIIVIIGPTGVGKTALAMELARKYEGEIVNADSRQIYADLKIGTSLPPDSYFKEISHHLFGVAALDEKWDAARFLREADTIIEGITQRKKVPLVVGGTGLYVRALLYGLFEGPSAQAGIRQELERKIEKEGLHSLYEGLKKIDPEAASKIHPNDQLRIIRALEVFRVTGCPISTHQSKHLFARPRYEFLKIGMNRDRKILHQKIEERVDEMIVQGLEAEVRGLVEKWGRNYLLSHAIGYKEWFPYFDGEAKKDEVIGQIKISTRQFAKNQLTWFRKEKDIEWFEADERDKIEKRIRTWFDRLTMSD